MKPSSTILHILPHAGGGVGAVLRALLAAESKCGCSYIHSIASLEYLNNVTQKHCEAYGIPWIDEVATKNKKTLSLLLDTADIVIVHWWNHPLLMRFLYNGIPPSRLAIWSHVNGFFAPQAFFPALFELPDRFVFSSQVSWKTHTVQNLPDTTRAKIMTIRSCVGIPSEATDTSIKAPPFLVGYIGTVENYKMHQDFLQFYVNAQIQSRCIVAGGPSHEALLAKAEALKIAEHFDILGPVKDPKPIFQRLHAFAYPLNPKHYGTGEQVLIEAMAYRAVPVVLANLPEMEIVRHGETGLVCKNGEEFSAALRMLRDYPAECDKLATGGRRFVIETCGIEHSVQAFHSLFEALMELPKRPHMLRIATIDNVKVGSPFHLFLSSCGDSADRKLFEEIALGYKPPLLPLEFTSPTRGTPYHYLSMLGKDPILERVCIDYYPQVGKIS